MTDSDIIEYVEMLIASGRIEFSWTEWGKYNKNDFVYKIIRVFQSDFISGVEIEYEYLPMGNHYSKSCSFTNSEILMYLRDRKLNQIGV